MTEENTPAMTAFEEAFMAAHNGEDIVEEDVAEEQIEEEMPEQEDEVVQYSEEEVEPAEEIDYEALYRAEEHKRKTVEGRFEKYREEHKKKEPEPVEAPVDHAEFWEEYSLLRDPITALIQSIVSKRLDDLNIESLKETVQTVTEDSHMNTILAVHPDLNEVINSKAFTEWMNNLPYRTSDTSMDAETAQKYYYNGTANEVIYLLSAFKNHRATPKVKPEGKSEDVAKRVASMVAVPSGASKPLYTQTHEEQSFEDAFEEFAKKKNIG